MKKIAESTVAIYTSNLKNKENKIVKRDICENASNCGVNKYNIKTFEKTKSNHVGADASVCPKTKNKYVNKLTSNNPISNLKPLTSNTAITLVALVITIIVLLILAGVTLNMIMGDSGIFSKANQAKNKTEVAQYEEELRMCVLELQTDAATNGTTFGIDTIRKNLVEKVKELENTEENRNNFARRKCNNRRNI